MTAAPVVSFLPAYIPADVDMDRVTADVGAGGVSVPPDARAELPALQQVVADAAQEGIDLKIVVVATNPPIETPLRDVANEVGRDYPGSTVLAISPNFAGTYSPTFNRITLEAGQDLARTGNPVQSSKNFLGELTNDHFPWTAFTIVLVLAVAFLVAATLGLTMAGKHVDRSSTAPSGDD